MSFAAWFLYCLLGFWIGFGSIWLLFNRKYTLVQAPRFLIDLLGFPVEISQRIWGRGGVPYALLLPNLIIFGAFTFLPMILNFYVSFTGGESIKLLQRPMVGLEHYRDLFDCDSILKPDTCSNVGLSFWTAMFNNVAFVVFAVPALCVSALLTALVVNKSLAGRGFWRAMFFYPVMLSPVVIANIWRWFLHRKGVLNETIRSTNSNVSDLAALAGFDHIVTIIVGIFMLFSGYKTLKNDQSSLLWSILFGIGFTLILYWSNPLSLLMDGGSLVSLSIGVLISFLLIRNMANNWDGHKIFLFAMGFLSAILLIMIQFDAVFDFGRFRPINWLVTPGTGWPFFWLVFVFTWSHMGFYMLILLAGLQAIPSDLYEAAEMDAAKPIKVFFRITLPLLMPTFTVVIILALIRCFQIFDEVYLLTGGGPGRETFMLVQNIYELAFVGGNPQYGAAAAGSVIMALVIATFTFIQLFVTRKQSQI